LNPTDTVVPRVLIVDASADSRAVFREALVRCGTQVLEAPRAQDGLDLARTHRPDLIVLDLDSDPTPADTCADFGRATLDSSAPIVVLGTARRRVGDLAHGEFIAKPYHYAPLIRRIEALLSRAA
jgi:DNA-binding response OmpR family regulator